jgi:hypothetical protein
MLPNLSLSNFQMKNRIVLWVRGPANEARSISHLRFSLVLSLLKRKYIKQRRNACVSEVCEWFVRTLTTAEVEHKVLCIISNGEIADAVSIGDLPQWFVQYLPGIAIKIT